jgi:ABC-type multidrug transport system fused ATPase/permease subunit
MLVIAHRPELVRSADRVVRLVDGVAAPEDVRSAA